MLAEKEREPEEGEAQKSPTQIVADSLSQISPASTFLPNIGVTPQSKPPRSTAATEARLRSEFEATIQAERDEAARKQEQLQAQLQAQQVTIQANQAALEQNQNLLRQTQEDMKGMQSKFEETNALLRAMLNLQRDGAGRST
jgi:DNA anti-recombination protein RmuC